MVVKKIISTIGIIPLVIIAVLLIIYFLFLPPILKYIIENQGEKQLGRKVEVGHASLNILNGSVKIKRLTIYEPGGRQQFLSFGRLFINFSVPDLFNKVYHIETLNLDEPVVHIVQHDSTFNFSDILARFASDTTSQPESEIPADTSESSGPVKYIVENLSITSGTISYTNKDFNLRDTIRHLKLAVPLFSYDNPVLNLSFFFDLASGGNFRGSCGLNTDDESMILRDTISDFNLSNYKDYLIPYINIGSLRGYFHTSNILVGSASTFDFSITGNLKLTDVALTDTTEEMVAGFREFSVIFDTISFSDDIMNFDTISLIEPVINFKMTPEGDNFSAMMYYDDSPEDTLSVEQPVETATAGANPVEMMVAYFQESMNTYLFQSYRIKCLQLLKGKVVYDDLSLDEPFLATMDNLDVILSNLSTEVDRSYGTLEARINEDGLMSAEISVNPRDILDIDLKYEIRSLMVPDFNPFSVYYIAYPFPRGAFNYTGSLLIKNRKLNSENKIVIEKINIGEKVKNKTAIGLPIKLAIALLRDRNGDIRLSVPVEGDLDDPKLKIGRLILDILKNLIIKAATAPYDLLASAFGGNEEDYKEVRFEYMSNKLDEKQKKQLEKMAAILTEKPELTITFAQAVDTEKEKAEIALFEAKKIFLFEHLEQKQISPQLTGADSLQINGIEANQDLLTFLGTKLDPALSGLSLPEKCYQVAGVEKVNLLQQALVTARNQALAGYFGEVLIIPSERFSVVTSTDPALINSAYPYFRIKFDVDE